MDAKALFLGQFKHAHDNLNHLVKDLSDEQANFLPPGKPGTIGAQFIHVLTAADVFFHVLQGQPPLLATSFAGKIGSAGAPEPGNWGDWGRTVKVNMTEARAYAAAVQAATEAFLNGLEADKLGEEVDFSSIGLGKMPRWAAINLILFNLYAHGGEISAIKGLQDLQGYAF
jgi:uncharacterized damage-inducible protein DinB